MIDFVLKFHWRFLNFEPHSEAKKLQILPITTLKCAYLARVNQSPLLVFILCIGRSLFHKQGFVFSANFVPN